MKHYFTALVTIMALSYSLYFAVQVHKHIKNTTVNGDILVKGATDGVLPVVNKNVSPEGNAQKSIKQLELTSANTILLVGEIGAEQSLLGQEINMKAQAGKPLYLLINSPGGSVMDGNLIVSAIQASPVPVYTICFQLCASMAAAIFSSGTKRFMVDRSILMFHEASGGFQGQFNQMKSRLNIFDKLVFKMDVEIARRAGIDPAVFIAKLPNELWLDAEDAVQQHFADGLVNVNLTSIINSIGAENRNVLKNMSQSNALHKKFQVELK
jgi:ATP-dependent Clp protease protease subunit